MPEDRPAFDIEGILAAAGLETLRQGWRFISSSARGALSQAQESIRRNPRPLINALRAAADRLERMERKGG